MNNVLTLTKVLLKNSFRGDKKQKVPTMLILAFILIPCLGVPIFEGINYLVSFSPQMGLNPISLLSLVLPISFILIFVTSIFSIVSTYFLSSDTEKLLPLPFKPWEIVIAKYLSSLVIVYIILFSVLFPILLGMGVGANANIVYYIYSIIITLIFPLIPTSILSLLITSLMKFSARSKSKDKFTYIVSIIAIIFSFTLSFGSNYITNNIMENTAQTITSLQELADSLGNTMMSIFFFLYPAYLALLNTSSFISILYLLAFVAISILLLVIFALVGQRVYLKGVMGGKASKNKKENKKEVIFIKGKSPFKALVIRDIKTIWRSPSFNMNLLLMEVLMPFIILISTIIGFATSEGGNAVLETFLSSINLRNSTTMGILILVAAFLSSTALASPTAISREGKGASFLKGIPVSSLTLVHSKMFFGVVSTIIIYFIVFIGAIILGFLSVVDFIFLTISVLPLNILMNYIGIMIDIKHPKLNWDNETVPVKQNFNAVVYMFGFWLVGGLFVLLGYLLPIDGYIYSLTSGIICFIGCLFFYRYIKKKDMELFKKL